MSDFGLKGNDKAIQRRESNSLKSLNAQDRRIVQARMSKIQRQAVDRDSTEIPANTLAEPAIRSQFGDLFDTISQKAGSMARPGSSPPNVQAIQEKFNSMLTDHHFTQHSKTESIAGQGMIGSTWTITVRVKATDHEPDGQGTVQGNVGNSSATSNSSSTSTSTSTTNTHGSSTTISGSASNTSNTGVSASGTVPVDGAPVNLSGNANQGSSTNISGSHSVSDSNSTTNSSSANNSNSASQNNSQSAAGNMVQQQYRCRVLGSAHIEETSNTWNPAVAIANAAVGPARGDVSWMQIGTATYQIMAPAGK